MRYVYPWSGWVPEMGRASPVVRDDPQQQAFTVRYQARTLPRKVLYLALHLVPGVLVYCLINISVVHDFIAVRSPLPDALVQGAYIIAITMGWHLLVPLILLRTAEKLSWRETFAFLALDRFDAKGFFLVIPIAFLGYILVTLPFMRFAYAPLAQAIDSIAWLRVPTYSIFQGTRIYALPTWMLLLFAIGNFIGEEVYFRGYLLKKIGFLGSWAWVVNSLLFAFYHMWQPAMTWPLVPFSLAFGLLMRWRKNLYPLILFHLLANLVWGAVVGLVLSHWH